MPSIIKELRALQPQRPLTPIEAFNIAERQASRLLKLSGIIEPHVPGEIIAALPRVRIDVCPELPVAGSSHWSNSTKQWVIRLNGDDAPVRQRFTLAHETKHILDHGVADFAYPATSRTSRAERIELTCDYFAACLLMPRPWVKRVYGQGLHEVGALAALFGVSRAAMRYRLDQLGLSDARRCQTYFRRQSWAPSAQDPSAVDLTLVAA